LLALALGLPAALVASLLAAFLYGLLRPVRYDARHRRPRRTELPSYPAAALDEMAILIASKDGRHTIGDAVRAALGTGVPVYVVSDGSTDDTAAVAERSGARVLALPGNVGKPAALRAGYRFFELGLRYRAIAILDDDVQVERNFLARAAAELGPDTAIVVGHNVTWWPYEKRWNPWLAKRAYSYWSYQATVRRLQSAGNVMNCISGSNSLYRTELLDRVLPDTPPYIVDDTYWLLETHRRGLGRVVYAPKARALLQDPTTLRDWYQQNLRWLWGTFQGIIGHRVGRTRSRFDAAYVGLMLHWLYYLASAPLTVGLLVAGFGGPLALLPLLAGYLAWVALAAWRLRAPRLVLFTPFIVAGDLLYRVIMVHALVKAIRQPVVDRCVWTSPARLAPAGGR
jgi:biofilm PGA synthesis N-glycosyltransferase PgaC